MNLAAAQLLLQGLARRGTQVAAMDGLVQPVLAPTQLLLPAHEQPDQPDRLDRPSLREAATAHAAAHLLHSRAGQDARGRKPLALAVLSAVEDARVERLLAASLPGVRRWFAAFVPAEAPAGLGFAALMARLDRVLADPHATDAHHWVQRAQQGFWALPADAPAHAHAQLALVLANMLGQMRVPFDAQFRPGLAYRDDHAYLWDHGRTDGADALPAPALAPAHAWPARQLASDAPPTRPAGDSRDGALPAPQRECRYGEWHDTLGVWRAAWCKVQERSVARSGAAPARRTRALPPESEGETLDLQAAVAALAERRRGQPWDARLFRRALPASGASVLLLLDLSQSTLAPWRGGGSTVQAAQQRAALRLAHTLTARGARVAVHGFASNGRAEVAYWRAVEFGAPCDAAALAALPVRHSTRLGAALRHAHALLLAEDARPARSLVLLTDGQPWDIDVFDAGHLLHDARRAVHALRSDGVRVACLAADARGVDELRAVFGAEGLGLLDSGAAMAGGLAAVARAATRRWPQAAQPRA